MKRFFRDHLGPAISLTALAFVVLGFFANAALDAQSANVPIPPLYSDILLWGQATVSAAVSLTDTVSNPTAPLIGDLDMVWDTNQWVRHKAAALATYPTSATTTARSIVGAQVGERSSRWSTTSNPSAGSQATASIALESSVRHVADTVCFSAGSTSAPSLTALTVNLRDGATGAGTVLATWEVIIPASTGQNVPPFCKGDLNLVGTTATAMTLEFSGGLANLIESVTLTGFNVQ